jgi:3,4-dihydroxy 2-butanone 4-phosphate synthase/GTP cyclohydrolase II
VGQTEASVDIARLAGLQPAGVICEILNTDGTMARRPELELLAKENNWPFITVAQLIEYRLRKGDRSIRQLSKVDMPTQYGHFELYYFENAMDNSEHFALVKGDLATTSETSNDKLPLIRMHSECLTGDVLGSLRCDCGTQLHEAMQQIEAHGSGALVYLRNHEGRGIGLKHKLKAYELQEQGADTVEANLELGFLPDLRHYGTGAQILLELGVSRFNLLTNNPKKIRGLSGYGLDVVNRVTLKLPNNT